MQGCRDKDERDPRRSRSSSVVPSSASTPELVPALLYTASPLCPHLLISLSVALSGSSRPEASPLLFTYLTPIHPSEPRSHLHSTVNASLTFHSRTISLFPSSLAYPKSPLFLELLLNIHIWIHFYACLVGDKRLQSGTVYCKGFSHSGRHGGYRHKIGVSLPIVVLNSCGWTFSSPDLQAVCLASPLGPSVAAQNGPNPQRPQLVSASGNNSKNFWICPPVILPRVL